eukprot:1180308-Prorocentrum_minimum.AAC.1
MDQRHNFMNGPKYGPTPDAAWERKKCCNHLAHFAPATKVVHPPDCGEFTHLTGEFTSMPPPP